MLSRLRTHLGAAIIFAVLTLFVFHTVLFSRSTDRVVSSSLSDMAYQFLPLRAFGFEQLRHGHFAQWCPYIYGGEPYLAGFQSALFYPPNVLHLLLPLLAATNWVAAVHIFFAGAAMYFWVRGRGAGFWAGVLAGVMFMFCGPLFLRIYAGHISHLCVMPWPPLLMWTIDRLAATGRWSACVVGIFGVTLALLGGSPQYVYYMGLISCLYAGLLLWKSPHRKMLMAGVVTTFVVASLVAAIQLLPSLKDSRETVRSGGTDYEFASTFAEPQENLLTMVMPGLFGNVLSDFQPPAISYYGRGFLWESSFFVGLGGLTLAVLAATGRWKRNWALASVVGVAIALALGRHLPIYRLLFDWLPMYGSFRAVSKFGYFIAMFLCPLAADGFDLLREGGRGRLAKRAAVAAGAAAVILVLFVIELKMSAGSPRSDWAGVMRSLADTRESDMLYRTMLDPQTIQTAALNAAHEATVAALVLGISAAMFAAAVRWPRVANGFVLLTMVEMILFARASFGTTVADTYPSEWEAAARRLPGDFRVVNIGLSRGILGSLDQGMALGIQNVWGYDPGVLKRYAETLSISQGEAANSASQYLTIYHDRSAIFQMLRTRLQFVVIGHEKIAAELPGAMQVAQLVPGYVVENGRDAVLARLTMPDFDPRKTVVLESPPSIVPASDAAAEPVESNNLSTDAIEIRATVRRPTLLLVTNNYSSGWRATAVGPNAPQKSYDIQPANRTLMAIPLAAGVHDIRLEYLPVGYRVGKVVSIVSLLAYTGACVRYARRYIRRS